MFAHFDGVVSEKNPDSVVLDVNGVGYLLYVSGATLQMIPPVGERVKLYSILNVREDAMELFGFYSREEKAMYERLRGVSGVGSRTAMQILSALSVRDLSIALVSGDAATLTRVPGIGKKTAQRLVLELRDKVDDDQLTGLGASAAPGAGGAASGRGPGSGSEGEAVAALMALGYSSSEAARAISRVAGQSDRTDELILLALRSLG